MNLQGLFGLDGKIALITGGSRGIGAMFVEGFLAAGAERVYISARKADQIAAAVEKFGDRVIGIPGDVSTVEGCKALAAEITTREGRLDILVNTAGAAWGAPFEDFPDSGWDKVMDVNVKGPFFLTQVLLPLIADGGRILNVSSGLARFSLPGSSAYAMMKGGIEVFSRYLARELGARGISANTLAPGAIETDFGGGHVRDNADINAMVAGNTALGRAGQPDDIGPVVAALLSPRTAWINAQRVEASGGMFV